MFTTVQLWYMVLVAPSRPSLLRVTGVSADHLCTMSFGAKAMAACAVGGAPPSISSPSPRGGSTSTLAGSAGFAEREGLRGQLSLRWHGGDGGSNRFTIYSLQ